MTLITTIESTATDSAIVAPEAEIPGLPQLILVTQGRYSGREEAILLSYQR